MIKKIFSKANLLIILLVAAVIPTFSSLLRPGFFPMHDDMQAMRLLQLDKCVKDGQIPCRWVPDMGYGYGYPQFNYYGPFPYYLMEGIHLLGFGYLDSVKAGFVISVLVAVFGMYLLGSSLWGSGGGFISAVLFAYAPYRAVDMYVRGAVGEFWALSIIPFIFWASREVIKGNKKSIIWLAISVMGLITSHNISSLIVFPVLGFWMLFLIVLDKKTILPFLKERIIDLGLGILWGFGLGAFFFFPAWFEKGFVHIETLLMGYFNYLAHFVSIKQLLFSTYWGYGASEYGPWDGMFLGIGVFHWILALVTLICLFLVKRKKDFRIVLFLVIFGLLSLFMSHSKSTFIWTHFPILSYLQFPWRFLILGTFVFSLASGAIASLIENKNLLKIICLVILGTSIFIYSSYFRPDKWLNINDADKFSGESWEKQLTISIYDYLPIYAKHPPTQKAPDKPIFIEGKGKIVDGKKGTNWQRWNVEVESSDTILELPIFYFPKWKVWVNGKDIPIDYDNELGLIRVKLTPGDYDVFAKLTSTPVRTLGEIITLVSILLLPVFYIKIKVKK